MVIFEIVTSYIKALFRSAILILAMALCCYSLEAQTNVIFDTDMDSDVDDVQALAMLHSYQQRQMIRLLAVVVTSNDSTSATCTDAVNTYYGSSTIPIGFLKKQKDVHQFSKYTQAVSNAVDHTVKSIDNTIESELLYRQVLSEAADSSIILITVGHLTSFQNLLASKPDTIRALSGMELAHRKIAKWYCMGGKFPNGKEANFYRPDPASTVALAIGVTRLYSVVGKLVMKLSPEGLI